MRPAIRVDMKRFSVEADRWRKVLNPTHYDKHNDLFCLPNRSWAGQPRLESHQETKKEGLLESPPTRHRSLQALFSGCADISIHFLEMPVVPVHGGTEVEESILRNNNRNNFAKATGWSVTQVVYLRKVNSSPKADLGAHMVWQSHRADRHPKSTAQ